MPKGTSGADHALQNPNWWEFGHIAWSIVAASVAVMSLVIVTTSFGLDLFGANRPKQARDLPTTAASITATFQHKQLRAAAVVPQKIYVAPNGSDQASGRTPSRPVKTIQQALNLAYPGSDIHVAPGRYVGGIQTVRDGSAQRPIQIIGEDGVELLGDSKTNHLVDIKHSYIHVRKLHINGLRGSGNNKGDYVNKLLYVQSHRDDVGLTGIVLDSLLVEHAGGECVRLRYNVTHTEVSNSTIRSCGAYDFTFNDGGKNGEGVYVGTAPEQRGDGRNPTSGIDRSSRNWIHNNRIETQANECVDIKEGSEYNVVENNVCSGQLDPDSAGFDSRGNYNFFLGNYVFNTRGSGFRLGGDTSNDGVYNTIERNRIKDTQGGGIKVTRLPQASVCGNEFINITQDRYFVGKQSTTRFTDSCQE